MPIYEYCCQQCKKNQEILQKFGEETPELCPACGARNSLTKIVSSSAFHLKGGGWYKDLYSSKKVESEPSPKGNEVKTDKKKDD